MAPKPVQVAFRVYANDWGMRGHGSRQIDWLVDGVKLHRDNVMFVIDEPISRHYNKSLKAKYRVYDASGYWNGYRWREFTRTWNPKHWVSYNDFHPRHKERNRILRDAGCQTWHYSHSVNLPSEGYAPWKELDYDHLVLWNETDAAHFAGGERHILGPLFSSQVPQTVVAVFDSTWANYPAGTEDKFFAGLFELLDRHTSMVMLYKPKWKRKPIERPRFYTLPEWIEPGLVIGCAHVTLSIYGCSTTVEADGAGKTAYEYHPFKQTVREIEKRITANLWLETPLVRATAADRFRELLLK